LRYVPDINSKPDDGGLAGEEHFDDVQGPVADVEFDQAGAGLERAQVGHEISQAEGGVNILRVERAKDDIGRHGMEIYQQNLSRGKGNSRWTGIPASGE
jgi:hypothetical protein